VADLTLDELRERALSEADLKRRLAGEAERLFGRGAKATAPEVVHFCLMPCFSYMARSS